MNPGVTEEAGQTARSLISSLSSTPMILAVLLFNVAYIGVTTYMFVDRTRGEQQSEARWERLVENAMRWCPAYSQPPADRGAKEGP